jgi:hypothetical protein
MRATWRLASIGFALAAACGTNDSGTPSDTADAESLGPDAGAGDVAAPGEAGEADGDAGAPSDASDGGAPSPDAGRDLSTDRAKFFGASRCAQAGVQLCEDFESGTLDKSTWSVTGSAPVIDGIQHARGSKALHVTLGGNGPSYIKETKTFPAPGNTYYGRAFFWFSKLPTAPGMTYAHWTVIAASGIGVPGEIRVSGQLQNGKNLFGVGTDNRNDGGTGDWTTSDDDPAGNPSPVPVGTWLCLEWLHDGAANETRFYWDAIEHPSLHTTATKHGGVQAVPFDLPQFTNVWIGWQEYQTSTEPFEVWVDEIAIDPARIGCVL